MIDPTDALELIRTQLRDEVLPHLDPSLDNYAHSVVVAAIGALREIGVRIVEADQWCEPSVERLRSASRTWPARLAHVPACAGSVADLIAAADAAENLRDARRLLLDAAEVAIEGLWSAPQSTDASALLHEIRELLTADTRLELEYAGRTT